MKAVILAGGRGTRLAPFTTVFPKPLVPLGERPIVEIIIRQLIAHGFRDIVLSVDYLAHLIRAYFNECREIHEQVDLRYVHDEAPAGTAGSLASIPGLDETFLVMNGDVLTTLDFAALIDHHRRSGACLTIATRKRNVQIDLGVLRYGDDGVVTGYREKPRLDYDVSMGVYVYEPRALAHIQRGAYLDFPDLVLALIAAGERVIAYPSDDYWLDIGRPEDYARANREFSERFAEFADMKLAKRVANE